MILHLVAAACAVLLAVLHLFGIYHLMHGDNALTQRESRLYTLGFGVTAIAAVLVGLQLLAMGRVGWIVALLLFAAAAANAYATLWVTRHDNLLTRTELMTAIIGMVATAAVWLAGAAVLLI